jgi:hypothetical protein
LRAFNNAADESLRLALGVKIDEKKDPNPIYLLRKLGGDMILYKPAFFPYLNDSHQFPCKNQVSIGFINLVHKFGPTFTICL